MLDSDAGQATLLSHCYLAMGEPVLAARVPKLAVDDVDYIMDCHCQANHQDYDRLGGTQHVVWTVIRFSMPARMA